MRNDLGYTVIKAKSWDDIENIVIGLGKDGAVPDEYVIRSYVKLVYDDIKTIVYYNKYER